MKTFSVTDAQTITGSAVPAGSYVKLTLSQNATTGAIIPIGEPITIALDDTGSCSESVWFNDELSPSGTFYAIQIWTPTYGVVYNQNVVLSGASFNLASYVPGSSEALTPYYIPALETNGSANTDQSLLNLKAGTGITLTADGSGGVTIAGASQGVTSVGLVDSTGLFTVTGSPVTTTGNLTLSAFASQTENTFLAAPNGSNGAPTFRAIAVADVPTLNQNTTGSAASAASLSISGQTGLLSVTGLASTNRIKTVRDAADTILELGGSYTPTGTWTSMTLVTPALGTPASGNLNNCVFGVANTTSGVVTLEGSTSGSCSITAPAVAGTSTNPIAVSNTINIPSGTAFSVNSDTFLSRSSANVWIMGNAAGQSNGTLVCAAISASTIEVSSADTEITRASGGSFNFGGSGVGSTGGTLNMAAINVSGTTATFGTAGSHSGTLTLEGSTSGSCTITAPAVAGTAANPIEFSNGIDVPSGTGVSWNDDTFLFRASANSLQMGSSVGSLGGTFSAGTVQASSAGATGTLAATHVTVGGNGNNGYLSLAGGTSGNATITAPGTAGTIANPFAFSNSINIASGTTYSINADTYLSRGASNTLYIGGYAGGNNGTLSTSTAEFASLYVSGGTAQFGTAGTTSGVITLEGSTSGSCTITAPATAGTSTNAIAVSNTINLPSGTAFSINGDTFLSRIAAHGIGVGNAAGDYSGIVYSGTLYGALHLFNGVATGLSSPSNGVVDVGSGAANSTSGTLQLTNIIFTALGGAPTSAGTAGTAGQVAYYSGLLYFCSVTGSAGNATWNKLNMTAV